MQQKSIIVLFLHAVYLHYVLTGWVIQWSFVSNVNKAFSSLVQKTKVSSAERVEKMTRHLGARQSSRLQQQQAAGKQMTGIPPPPLELPDPAQQADVSIALSAEISMPPPPPPPPSPSPSTQPFSAFLHHVHIRSRKGHVTILKRGSWDAFKPFQSK